MSVPFEITASCQLSVVCAKTATQAVLGATS